MLPRIGSRARLLVLVALCVPFALAGCGEAADAAPRVGEDGDPTGGTALVDRDAFPARPAASTADEARTEVALRDPRNGAWNADLRGLVNRWVDRAREKTGGKAHRDNVHVGLHVVDLETGVVLAALDDATARRPASGLKLVTTAAALVLFGPEAEFATPFEAAGAVEARRLVGDLVVRASGDPLIEPDQSPRIEGRVRVAARELVAAGVETITGDVVLDEGTFLTPAPGPEWPSANQHWQAYCALSGGFSVNGGVLSATVTPTRPGEPARVELHPVPHGLRSILRPRTVAKGKLTIGGEARSGRVLVQGDIPSRNRPFEARFSHPDPVDHFGAVLLGALGDAGVRVEGEIRRARNVRGGPRLATLRSSVAASFRPINAESDNGAADQLFLALGHATGHGGTREGGQRATMDALRQLGVPTAGLVQVDGSGLSRANRIAPAQFTALLRGAMRLSPESRAVYLDSLAVAGEVGTLEDRMRGTSAQGRVAGKTGWIAGTSSLSGIVRTLEGRILVFSCLIEYPKLDGLNTSVFKPMTDALCVQMVERSFPGIGEGRDSR